MSSAGEHSTFVMMPTAQAFEALLEEVRGLRALLEQHVGSVGSLDLGALGFEPMKIVDAKEAARMLGINRVASVYEIPEDELPRVRRVGSSVGYLALNVWLYAHGLPPVDMQAVLETYRERLVQDRPSVRVLHPNEAGKTRVL